MPQTKLVSDLNVVPTENDGEVCGITDLPDTVARTTYIPINQVKVASASDAIDQMKMASVIKYIDVKKGEGKMLIRFKMPFDKSGEQPIDTVSYADSDQKCQLVSPSHEEKVCSLKAGLVHVARKVPKNAHAHFILGLMYQRLGQPQKAVLAFEKSSEILLKCEEEISRPDLLSLVQIHHAQCLLQGSSRDGLDKELDLENLDEILLKMKESLSFDIRQSSVWNTLSLILLRTGRVQSAISILSSLLKIVPDYLDALANLGMAYLQKGNLELSQKCFQDLILKDQNHPAALVNYGALLLCKHGSVIEGPGAHADEGACESQAVAANVATECLLAAVRQEPKSAQLWMNLANAYYLGGNHQGAGKCLEQAAKLNPTLMSIRFAVAVHRIKDAEKFQDPTEKLSWAANEMASILKDGDPNIIEPQLAWAGMAMVHRAQHQISSTFGTQQKGLTTIEEQALYSLNQAVQVKPEDSVSWHQLGLHDLCTLQFKRSQKYLKAAVARNMKSCYAWSNLGVSLQLSEEDSDAEEVYKRALSLSTNQQAHTVLSNLGNLHRQQEQFGLARSLFAKSLEICPGYAPAYNNLGLVYVAEGRWEDAKSCFRKSLEGDPLLDAAKSNLMKAIAMSKCTATETSVFEDKRVAANFI